FRIKRFEITAATDEDEICLVLFIIADIDDLIRNIGDTFAPMEFDLQPFGQPSGECGYGFPWIDDDLVAAVKPAEETIGPYRAGCCGDRRLIEQPHRTAFPFK